MKKIKTITNPRYFPVLFSFFQAAFFPAFSTFSLLAVVLIYSSVVKMLNLLQENLINSVMQKHKLKSPKKKDSPVKKTSLKIKIKRKANSTEDVFTPRRSKRRHLSDHSSLTASLFDPNDQNSTITTNVDSIALDNLVSVKSEENGLNEASTNECEDGSTSGRYDNSEILSGNMEEISPFIFVDTSSVTMNSENPKIIAGDSAPAVTIMLNNSLCSSYENYSQLNSDLIISEKCKFTNVIFRYIMTKDFSLPQLNLKWRLFAKPTPNEVKCIKNEFPCFTRSWTVEEEKKIYKRFKKLMKRSGFCPNNQDSQLLLTEIRSLPNELSTKMKMTLAGYVGKPFLDSKLCVNVWKRLVKMIEAKDMMSLEETQIQDHNANETIDENNENCTLSSPSEILNSGQMRGAPEPIPRMSFVAFFTDKFRYVIENLDESKEIKKFHKKLYKVISKNDFHLPQLNCQKWSGKYPNRMPTISEMERFKRKFPKLTKSRLTPKEENHILNRLDTLLKEMNLKSTTIQSRTSLIDKLVFSRSPYVVRLRILVGAYVGGSSLLQRRFAIDVWEKLKVLISDLHGANLSKAVIKEEDTKKSKKNISDIKEALDLSRGRKKKRKPDEKANTKGNFTAMEDELLIYHVFKELNMNNIRQLEENGKWKIGWKNLSRKLDRRPDLIRRRWQRLCTMLKLYEYEGMELNDFDHLRNRTIECVLKRKDWQCLEDVDRKVIIEEVKYWEHFQIGNFLTKVSRCHKALPFREALILTQTMIQSRQESRSQRRPPSSVCQNVDLAIRYYESVVRNKIKFD